MNHEQWTDFLTAAQGHKKNLLGDCDPEGMASIAFCAGWTDADVSLAAAAPALLEDNKRLREWLMVISREAPTQRMEYMAESAINGSEAPK